MKALNTLRMGRRLGLGFAVVLALVVCICALGWVKLQSTRENAAKAAAVRVIADQATRWHSLTMLNANRTLAIAKSGNHEGVQSHFAGLMKQTSAEITELQKSLEGAASTDEERATFKEIAARRKVYIDARDEALRRLKSGDAEAVAFIDKELVPLVERYLAAIAELGKQEGARAEAIELALQEEVAAAQTTIAVLGLLCVFVGVLVRAPSPCRSPGRWRMS